MRCKLQPKFFASDFSPIEHQVSVALTIISSDWDPLFGGMVNSGVTSSTAFCVGHLRTETRFREGAFHSAMPRQLLNRKWSAEEDEKLRLLWTRPLTVNAIAVKMRRSRDTILLKARQLGLPPKQRPAPLVRAPAPDRVP